MFGATGGTSLQMSSAAQSALSDRSPINIAPIATNLGAIMQPVSQGPPENGGVGADFMRRYSGGFAGLDANKVGQGVNWTFIAIAGGVGLVGLFFILKR